LIKKDGAKDEIWLKADEWLMRVAQEEATKV
jgi:hypothetical protein